MGLASDICPVCGKSAEISGMQDGRFGLMIRCVRCGLYMLSSEAIRILHTSENNHLRSCLSYYLANGAYRELPIHIVDDDYQDRLKRAYEDQCSILTIQEALQIYPHSHTEKIDRILLNLANESEDIGDVISVPYTDSITLKNMFFLEDSDEGKLQIKSNYMVNYLVSQKFAKQIADTLSGLSFTLDIAGWERVEQMQQQRKTIPSVILINPPKKKYRKAVQRAVLENQLRTIVLQQDDGQEGIPSEWLYELEQAEALVLHDLISDDIMFYLVGYAEAIGVDVIITLPKKNKKESSNPYSQFEPIQYQDYEDLTKKLSYRIKTTR